MSKSLINTAKQVLDIEINSLKDLQKRIDSTFLDACNLVNKCDGKVVLIGMGKSGHIGNKIAATLASTGTPSFAVHPAEAGHGDLGMITPGDVVITISYSGASEEIITLVPIIQRLNIPIIAMTGNVNSSISKVCDVHLDISVEKEACPHNLAPTSSTTVTLAMGDALAISLLTSKGFGANDFGGTMMEENVVSAAGETHHLTPSITENLIKDAGFIPKQRTQDYRFYGA